MRRSRITHGAANISRPNAFSKNCKFPLVSEKQTNHSACFYRCILEFTVRKLRKFV